MAFVTFVICNFVYPIFIVNCMYTCLSVISLFVFELILFFSVLSAFFCVPFM